jgi:hypothetical protein
LRRAITFFRNFKFQISPKFIASDFFFWREKWKMIFEVKNYVGLANRKMARSSGAERGNAQDAFGDEA